MILDEKINGVVRVCRQMRLFPDIHFTCNGSITKWIVGAETGSNSAYQPELQIWRRYSGRGISYSKINFSLLTQNETSVPNVHEYYPDPPLEFQEGDILGVYQPRCDISQLVVYHQQYTGPRNYGQFNIGPPAPSFFKITSILETPHYPLVTVEISRLQNTAHFSGVSATHFSRATVTSSPSPQAVPSITPPALPSLSMKAMYVFIGVGVVLILVVVTVIPTVLICLCARANKKQPISKQIDNNGRKELEDQEESPVYTCKSSWHKAGQADNSNAVRDQQMAIQANPAYMTLAAVANQGKVNGLFPTEEDEYENMSI